jgi:O-antigen/teichoic acid export membrane protein
MTQSTNNIGKITRNGVLSISLATLITKFLSIGSQWFTGFYLDKKDFAIYATVLGIGSIIGSIQDGGIDRVLIKSGQDFYKLAYSCSIISFFFRFINLVLLVITGVIYYYYYGMQHVPLMLLLLGIVSIINIPTAIRRVQLSVELQFKTLSILTTINGFIRQSSLIIFAYFNAGCYSFLFSWFMANIGEYLCIKRYINHIPVKDTTLVEAISIVFKPCCWLIAGSLAIAVINQGDYLMLGFIVRPEILANYFFGFQLTGSITGIIVPALLSVLVPVFSSMSENKENQKVAFTNIVKNMVIVVSPILGVTFLTSEFIVDLLWSGKWNDAIYTVKYMAIASIPCIIAPVAHSYLQSVSSWKLYSVLLSIEASGIILAVIFINLFTSCSNQAVAFILAFFRCCTAIFTLYMTFGKANCTFRAFFDSFIIPFILIIVACSTTVFIFAYEDSKNLFTIIPQVILSLSIYLILLLIFARQNIVEVKNLLFKNLIK